MHERVSGRERCYFREGLLRLGHPPRLLLDPHDFPRPIWHRHARMTVNTDADVLVVALVDRLHLALADGAHWNASGI